MSGHRAEYVMEEQGRGWWLRLWVGGLRMACYCGGFGRGIGIELIGQGGKVAHLQSFFKRSPGRNATK
jgi:hypothetical protein